MRVDLERKYFLFVLRTMANGWTIRLYTKWFSIDLDLKGFYVSINTKWGWYYILIERGVFVMKLREIR